MEEIVQILDASLRTPEELRSPPLHRWHPPLNGDIPIRISHTGAWYHEGVEIQRPALIRLFSTILRREADGEYYLVTPVEKWRIEVERHALVIVDIDRKIITGEQWLEASLNTDARFTVSEQHPLFLDESVGNIAAMHLTHGLTALCTRAAWSRLVELADETFTLSSGSYRFTLSS